MKAKNTDKRYSIAYINPSPRFTKKAQLEAVNVCKPDKIYTQSRHEDLEDCIASLREGDLFIVDGLGRLADSQKELYAVLKAIDEKGVDIFDTSEGVIADPKAIAALSRAGREMQGIRSMPSSDEARRRGALGGKTIKTLTDKDRSVWRDPNTTDGRAARKIGVSVSTLRRHFGPSGRLPGHPRKSE